MGTGRQLLLLIACLAAWPATAVAADAPSGLRVYVTVQPQATFVNRLAGPHAEVRVLVPANANHENYEPTPRQIQELTRAQLYFQVGMPFEEVWIAKIQANNPGLTVVDTRQGIQLLQMSEHGRSSLDPHIWLDPNLVKLQAKTMAAALAKADPRHAAEYRRNLEQFTAELDTLDREIRKILAPATNRVFMVHHPAWGYFAQAYNLTQLAVEVEGKEPGPRTMERIIQEARRHGIKTIFVQAPLRNRTVRSVAATLGARIVSLDPLARDYFQNMRQTARLLSEG